MTAQKNGRFLILWSSIQHAFWFRKHFEHCDPREGIALYNRCRNAIWHGDEIQVDDLKMKIEDVEKYRDLFVELLNEYPEIKVVWKAWIGDGGRFTTTPPKYSMIKHPIWENETWTPRSEYTYDVS